MKRVRKFTIYLSAVFALLIIVFMFFRHRGIVICANRACGGKLGLCYLLSKLFPDREVTKYKNGKIQSIVISDGVKPCSSVWTRYDDAKVIRGDYYSPSGELISTVRDGNGFAAYTYNDGEIRAIIFYKNGEEIKDISFYRSGSIESVTRSDSGGYLLGNIIKYDEKGNEVFTRTFENK